MQKIEMGNDKMPNIDFDLLARKIAEFDFTYKNLQKITGISRGTLHNVLTGKTKPSYEVARILSDTLPLSQKDLMAIYFPNAKP